MKELDQILAKLHTELALQLLERLRSGEAKAADLNVIRQFLKDNGIDSVPKEESPLGNLVNELPFSGEAADSGQTFN